jgi:hypothetical protein
MSNSVKIVAASRNTATGTKLWTVQLRYWRAIHAELMTHRAFSRNAGSSRAIPVKKMLSQVWNDPAGPIHWGANQPGMQAHTQLKGWRRRLAKTTWRLTGKVACIFTWGMMKLGLHKQVANRLLEPWQYINVVVSATDWENFFHLRCHEDAQPEIRALAEEIEFAMQYAEAIGDVVDLEPGQWHLPYVTNRERRMLAIDAQLKLSTARCARVSYEPFDGNAAHEKEFERHDKLVGSEPIHASPTEHQAVAFRQPARTSNFQDWEQYRYYVERKLPVSAA